MAIKRIDPKATFKVVSQFDDALENETPEELAIEGKPEEKKKSRYEKYLETFNLEDLKFKEGVQPSYFHVRCLLASELAEINQKYQVVDVVNKTIHYKDRNQMMLEIFARGVVGLEDAGAVQKVTADEVGFNIATEVGSLISLMTTLGKNVKKA